MPDNVCGVVNLENGIAAAVDKCEFLGRCIASIYPIHVACMIFHNIPSVSSWTKGSRRTKSKVIIASIKVPFIEESSPRIVLQEVKCESCHERYLSNAEECDEHLGGRHTVSGR